MSKTIEIVSIHTGKIRLCTRKGEQRTVMFEDKGDRGFALCDEDEAEILLGGIGLPDYWKPGQGQGSQPTGPITIPPAIPAAETGEAETGEAETGEEETGEEETGGEETGGEETGGEGDNTPPTGLTKEGYETIRNAAELQAILQTCEDTALIMELVASEAQKEPSRSTWMKALNDRLAALQK